jgi:hypothetical protein
MNHSTKKAQFTFNYYFEGAKIIVPRKGKSSVKSSLVRFSIGGKSVSLHTNRKDTAELLRQLRQK